MPQGRGGGLNAGVFEQVQQLAALSVITGKGDGATVRIFIPLTEGAAIGSREIIVRETLKTLTTYTAQAPGCRRD